MSTGGGARKRPPSHPSHFTSPDSGHYPGEEVVPLMKLVSLAVLAVLVLTLATGCSSPKSVHGRATRSASGGKNMTVKVAGMLLQIRSGARNTWIVLRHAAHGR
jgi:hypothetical protein